MESERGWEEVACLPPEPVSGMAHGPGSPCAQTLAIDGMCGSVRQAGSSAAGAL